MEIYDSAEAVRTFGPCKKQATVSNESARRVKFNSAAWRIRVRNWRLKSGKSIQCMKLLSLPYP
jgi:hypothetical protein